MKKSRETPREGGQVPAFFSPHVQQARRFYLDLTPTPSRPLVIVCGGCEHCSPDYRVERGTFPYLSIEFVVRGRGTVRVGGRTHALLPGRVLSYGPGVPHEIVADPTEPPVKYFVDFVGSRARALLKTCQLAPGSVGQVSSPGEVQNLFDELIRNGVKHTPHSGEICARLLECLALKIAETRAPLEGVETFAFTKFRQCRELIEEHFLRLRTLEQVAEECHVSDAYLCRLFQRYDHQSPYQCLLRLKMNCAADLLQQPGALVKQVAEQVGFVDPFHFSRAFKAVFGMSPDAFRSRR